MISGVESRCWILALFIRSDGQRLLLGDGAYDFKESQQHFQANTYDNDTVEVQGSDGILLAGQVRRASKQGFDGYVGDATMTKAQIEQYRRNFFMFFRKNYFYEVVYIFPNGDTIMRQRGFIVDAPEVEELWQIHPEYHVALNFEDVNYYAYAENEQGQVIYSGSAIVPITGATAGGLVWDSIGAVNELSEAYASGTVFTITNSARADVEINSFEMYGESTQNGTPTPSSPVEIKTVTGSNTVTIDGVDVSTQLINLEDKNLLDLRNGTYTNNGVTVVVKDGVCTVNGTATATSFVDLPTKSGSLTLSANTTYTFSLNNETTVSGSNHCRIGNITPNFTINLTSVNGTATGTPTADQTATNVLIFRSASGTTYDNFQIKPMLEIGDTATTYEEHWGGELNKVGDSQDYIYKSGDDWYVHKAVFHGVLNGSETWRADGGTVGTNYRHNMAIGRDNENLNFPAGTNTRIVMSDRFVANSSDAGAFGGFYASPNWLVFQDKDQTYDLTAWKAWLAENQPEIFYQLATPYEVKLTNADLIAQLEGALALSLNPGENEVSTATDGAIPTLKIGYESLSGGGFVWEAGEGIMGDIIVNSVDNVYPVWTVTGETVNPTLENVTTGTLIQYNGTITDEQTLVIDMTNQTATLNGANVIGNVTGDWLMFAPGRNRIVYTADNQNAPASKIEWNDIVG